jgi:tetratricopeptide (TPR) repeat protein
MMSEFLRQLQSVAPGEDREWLVLQLSLEALSPALRDAIRAGAIPHWFDHEFLGVLLGRPVEEARGVFEDLSALSFVEQIIGRGQSLHASTRALLLKRLWQDDQGRFRDLSGRAAAYCATQDQSQLVWPVELVYHLLVASPEKGIESLESVAQDWRRVCAYDAVESLLRAAREHADAGRLTGFGAAVTRLWEAHLHRDYSRFLEARDTYEGAGRLFHELGRDLYEARALLGAGAADLSLDEYEAARDRFGNALNVFRRTGDKRNEGRCLHGLGDTHRAVGEFEIAQRYYEEARQEFHKNENFENEAYVLWAIGEVNEALGEFETAVDRYEEAKRLFDKVGSPYGKAVISHKRGVVHCVLGAYQEARQRCDEALAAFQQIGARDGEAHCLEALGKIHNRLGEVSAAEQCYERARVIYQAIGDRRGLASSLRGLGEALQRQKKQDISREYCEQARQICHDIHDSQGEADCVLCAADLDSDAGCWPPAEAGYLRALKQYRAARAKPQIAVALLGLGKVRAHLGCTDAARGHLTEALNLLAAMRLPQAEEAKAELSTLTYEADRQN